MKNLKITISLLVTGDEDDQETLQSDIYEKLHELMDSEELEFDVTTEDEDD